MSDPVSLDDVRPTDLAMLEPFASVVAWVLFDAKTPDAEDLGQQLLNATPSPHESLIILLRAVNFARRCHGPVVPWSAWTPTFQALAQHPWDPSALRWVLLLASCTSSDSPPTVASPGAESSWTAPLSVERPFTPAFWAAFLPVAQPLIHMLSDRLDLIDTPMRRGVEFWERLNRAIARQDLDDWLIKQNVYARSDRSRSFSLSAWNAFSDWNRDLHFSWDILVSALLWRAVSDRRESDPILELGGVLARS